MWSIFFILILIPLVSAKTLNEVLSDRNDLMTKEYNLMLGSDIVLSDSEQKANDIIMKLKYQELDHAFHHPQMFNVTKHFFDFKDEVKDTPLFKIIQQMPKGALLHAHDTGILSPDYVLELTYWEDLYICVEEGDIRFLFSENIPNKTCDEDWELLKDMRYSYGSVEEFDAEIRKLFTIVIENPKEVHTDINTVWSMFQQYFIISSGVLTYKPVWEQYFYDTLKALRDDNIMYFEVRSVLPELYDMKGNIYDSVETAQSYKKVLDQFMTEYPDFSGAKLIYSPMRLVDTTTVHEYIATARKIKDLLPDFFAGFDLVGQEDLGNPLDDFMSVLVDASDEFTYFFHAGETNWNGMSSNENIVDAIVLGAKRIGHAFAIIKQPVLCDEIKKRDIAIEVNVVSNNVLKLVDDVRNHPLASYLAQGLPVVLSSDDPGVWEAEPLSHDFYISFLGVASRHADLKMLKRLALNSLYYSAHSDKHKLLYDFEVQWTKFIDSVVRDKW